MKQKIHEIQQKIEQNRKSVQSKNTDKSRAKQGMDFGFRKLPAKIKRSRRSIQLARFLCIMILPKLIPHRSDRKEEKMTREVRRRRTEKEWPVMFMTANPIEPVWVQPE